MIATQMPNSTLEWTKLLFMLLISTTITVVLSYYLSREIAKIQK